LGTGVIGGNAMTALGARRPTASTTAPLRNLMVKKRLTEVKNVKKGEMNEGMVFSLTSGGIERKESQNATTEMN